MKYGKSAMPMLLASILFFVGTLATKTPTCLGCFYEPKKPIGLHGPNSEKDLE